MNDCSGKAAAVGRVLLVLLSPGGWLVFLDLDARRTGVQLQREAVTFEFSALSGRWPAEVMGCRVSSRKHHEDARQHNMLSHDVTPVPGVEKYEEPGGQESGASGRKVGAECGAASGLADWNATGCGATRAGAAVGVMSSMLVAVMTSAAPPQP
jgi:hypothetical protein